MSLDEQLTKLVSQYLASKVSFDEMAAWVQDEEPYWATLPQDSSIRLLAGIVMLMAYEVWAGDRYESTAREVIRQESAAVVGA